MKDIQIAVSVNTKKDKLYLKLWNMTDFIGHYGRLVSVRDSEIIVSIFTERPKFGVKPPQVNRDGTILISLSESHVFDSSLDKRVISCKFDGDKNELIIDRWSVESDLPLELPRIRTVTHATKAHHGFPENSDFARLMDVTVPYKFKNIHKTSKAGIPYADDQLTKQAELLAFLRDGGSAAIRKYIQIMARVAHHMHKANWPICLLWDKDSGDFVTKRGNKEYDIRASIYAHTVVVNAANGDDAIDSFGNAYELKSIFVNRERIRKGQNGQLMYGSGNILDVLHINYKEYETTDLENFNKTTIVVVFDDHSKLAIECFAIRGNDIVSFLALKSKKKDDSKKLYPERHKSLRDIINNGFRFDSMAPTIGLEKWMNVMHDYLRAQDATSRMNVLERQVANENLKAMDSGKFLQSL